MKYKIVFLEGEYFKEEYYTISSVIPSSLALANKAFVSSKVFP